MAAGALVSQRPAMQPAMESEFEKAVQMLNQSKAMAVEESVIAPREKTFRSHFHPLPPIPHTNLAAFVMENATGRFASKTAFVDGTTGASYSYSQVGTHTRQPIHFNLTQTFVSKLLRS